MSNATATRTAVPTGTWEVDPSHSTVEFRVKHLGISTVRGRFEKFGGTLEIGDDIASAKASGTAEAASVSTGDDGRDQHLRAPDFFDVERHPEIGFSSKTITPTGGETFDIAGELTLHGVTRDLTLQAEITGTEQDPWGNDRVGLEVSGELDRRDYGITFNQALGTGNLMVSDKVRLRLDVSAVRKA